MQSGSPNGEAESTFEDPLRYINEQDKFGKAPLRHCFPPPFVNYTVEEDAVTNQRHLKATPDVPKPEELTENHQRYLPANEQRADLSTSSSLVKKCDGDSSSPTRTQYLSSLHIEEGNDTPDDAGPDSGSGLRKSNRKHKPKRFLEAVDVDLSKHSPPKKRARKDLTANPECVSDEDKGKKYLCCGKVDSNFCTLSLIVLMVRVEGQDGWWNAKHVSNGFMAGV